MGAPSRSKRLPWVAAIAAFVLIDVVIVVLVMNHWYSDLAADQAMEDGETAPDEPSAGAAPPSARALPPSLATGDAGAVSVPEGMTQPRRKGADGNEYPVDLAYLRARIPDNLYWRLGQPTQDPELLRQRAEEEKRWNDLFGKVQSNTASEEEVHRYYDHRRQLSEDYLELARLVLEEYGDELPERDRGMYELSIEMHGSRLAEIPRQLEDALARKRAHDQRRDDWRQGR